jgi:hypothetical protein
VIARTYNGIPEVQPHIDQMLAVICVAMFPIYDERSADRKIVETN